MRIVDRPCDCDECECNAKLKEIHEILVNVKDITDVSQMRASLLSIYRITEKVVE